MKRELSHSILALIFIGGFVFLGCVNPNSDRYFFWNDPLTIAYAEATEVNTLEAYENFLKKYPNSEYLAEVLWRITLIKDTVEDYEKFKLQYPKFNPQIDWIITEKKDSIESYESFLKLYPNSGYDEEVAWRIAEEKDTYEAYETFLKKYSNSPSTWAKEAKKRLYAYSPNISKTSEGLKESNIGKSYTKKDLFNKNVTSLNNYEKFGGYYALVIGNNNYKMLPKLKTCINDARAIAAILEKKYEFIVVKITDGTRIDIINALDNFRSTLKNYDNLLIYYAGHGYFDEGAERGYWLPIDANENSSANWISNVDITDKLKAIKADHVIVIADSCYSGTLTRGINISLRNNNYYERIIEKRSRTVLTSGGVEPVLDSGGGQHSVFAKYIIKSLRENESVIDGTQLFSTIRRLVILNARQTPQYFYGKGGAPKRMTFRQNSISRIRFKRFL